ncbi:MAG: TonB-dependent receptor [Acidobacteria bacterium]|nr:TonB-dependent receptor [Acidobacteriota bacterium]
MDLMRGILWTAVLLPGAALAQPVTGSVSGHVRDVSGRSVPGATVTAEDAAASVVRTAGTGVDGSYRIPSLPPGIYRITATASNLQPVSAGQVEVTVDAQVRQDFEMRPGDQRDAVTVEARTAAPDTVSPSLGLTLDRGRIASLPLNRRDFLQLCLLAPGILPPVQDSELSSRGSFAMHAGGAREEFNNFTLDGADNNDPYTNRYVLQPSVESIREFRVLSNSYSAEYGRNAGAQVNVVTRSGTNSWHGAAYEYLRNRVLDARNFFEGAERPKYIRNQFGGSLGGPVLRERAFVFTNYEGLRERRGLPRLSAVPSSAEREGQLSRTVADPFTRQPFPGNRIPASRMHPLAGRILSLFPAANQGTFHLAQPALADASHQFLARGDMRATGRDEITVRYGWGAQDLAEPFAEEVTDVPGFGNLVANTGHNISAQHQRIWSGSMVQTTRFTFTRSFREVRQQNQQTDVGQLWGVNWLRVQPRDFGYPSIKVGGFAQVGDPDQLPIGRSTDTWQVQPSISVARGAHWWKAGAEVRRLATDGYLDYFSRGTMTFSGALSGQGIGDLLLGLPSFALQSRFDNRQSLRNTAWYGFFQDDWRVSPSLQLSLGVRYEFTPPPVDPEDRMYAFVPATGRLQQVGTGGVPRAGIGTDRNNLAPRAGFAWSPAQRWTIRGGYGIFFDSGMSVVNSSFYFNPPLFNVRVFFPTAQGLLSLSDPFPTGGGITPPPSPNTLSPDITSGYLQQWNFTVEREVSRSTVMTASYAASKGTHLIRSRDLNQPRPGSPVPAAARRPNPAFGGIFYSESGANSNFHSLQMKLDRRLSRRFSALAAYTWSKSIDDTSAFLSTKADKNFPQDSNNYFLERALSSYDMRHRVSGAFTAAAAGFEFRSIFAAQTGQPFTPLLRFDNSNTGNAGSIFGNDRPDVLRNPRLAARRPERWFDTAAFAIARPNAFGTAGRNIVAGPGLINFDAGISRPFRLGERWTLTADLQAFNLLNTAHFDLPERYADEPATFGRVLSAKPPRQIQIGLRLGF